jgi:acetyl-CoA synthetase
MLEFPMSREDLFSPPAAFAEAAHVKSTAEYEARYRASLENPLDFWSEIAGRLEWQKPFTKVLDHDFHQARISWFEDGEINACVNCVDRHVAAGRGDRRAIIFEGDEPGDGREISYAELLIEVSRFANVLRKHGVEKGDRVCLYMPMVPELAVAVLACARIGAVHSVVFGGFSAESLRQRIEDCRSKIVLTADEGLRGAKTIPLKTTTDRAVEGLDFVETLLVLKRTGAEVAMKPNRDFDWHAEMAADDISDHCEPARIGAEDPLFILYTSGSTGTPKGVLHTTGGYLTYASYTHEMVFDHRADDVYWCTADIGWITGHSYIVYGPLANGATTLMFEGVPTYPDVDRFWDVVDRHQVTLFYTAPTAIRALMRHGEEPVRRHRRSSLRLLGTVGEPINPEVWHWYHEVVGEGRCPIVDTWWQTETGGTMITPLPGATPTKPGSATRPFFGIRPVLVDDEGEVVEGNGVSGNLCIDFPWPGMMRTVYGDHPRFVETYFSRFPGRYFTGDGCRRDEDGYYWITGRVDDVINVSGHRLGTAEVESALITHSAVAEAAVVGFPHEIKGQGIFAFVLLKEGLSGDEAMSKELVATVRQVIGPVATPDRIRFASGLPKTRSGKIMRRILRKLAAGEREDFGDVSTLADPDIVKKLLEEGDRS